MQCCSINKSLEAAVCEFCLCTGSSAAMGKQKPLGKVAPRDELPDG